MRASTEATAAALALLCGGSVGCDFSDSDSWSSQLKAAGPCWSVDISDGLDADSTDELQQMVDCFDKGGILQPLRPVTDALDAPGPSGEVVGLGLIRWANDLLAGGLNLAIAVQDIADALAQLDTAIELSTRVAIELVYGRPYRTIGTEVALNDPSAMEQGLVVPALPVLGDLALQAATDDGALVLAAHDAIAHPAVPDLACTVLAVGRSSDPAVQQSLDGLPRAIGAARVATLSPENDRWGYASGDSLRDLSSRLLANDAERWHTVMPLVAELLRTDGLAPRVETALVAVVDGGHLDQLPRQLRYLATVDRSGNPVGPGEGADTTAWTSLLRLLSNANEPASCTVDLGFTDLDIDLGNVAVALLEYLARQDPEFIAGALDLVSGVLGLSLTDDILNLIAGSGACPVLDHRFVDDLQSINRLTDRESEDLLYAAIFVLAALEGGEAHDSSVPLLVDTIDALYVAGLVEPTGELLIDLGDSEVVDTFIGAIPWMVDPTTLAASQCPIGTTPLTFEAGWNLLDDVAAPRTSDAALSRLGPTMANLADDDRVWALLDLSTPLLQSTDALVHQVPRTLIDAIAEDPELGARDAVLRTLEDPTAWEPFVALAATPAVREGLATTDAPSGGPLPYLSRLVIDGTLDDLMRTLAMAADLLTGEPVTGP